MIKSPFRSGGASTPDPVGGGALDASGLTSGRDPGFSLSPGRLSFGRLAWQGLLALVLVLLAWRITALALASQYVAAIPQRGEEAARQALEWYPGQSAALYQEGLALLERDATAGIALLEAAYAHNPTDPLPLRKLADVALAAGDEEQADRLIERVAALRPTDALYQQNLGQYWLGRGRPVLAFQHWTQALRADVSLGAELFPRFRDLLADPAMGEAFAALALTPPSWWGDFFADSARQLADLDLLQQLYRLRGESTRVPLSQAEYQAYFVRLMREGLMEEARFVWVNSLDEVQRQHLGALFNGGFELPLGGVGDSAGFNWRITPIERVEMARARPEGENRNALRVRFRLLRLPFRHLSQTLLLSPGAYALTGVSRGQSLITESGLRWVLRCLPPDERLLGDSERFFGSEGWTPFRVEFEIPEDCPYQEIRLVSVNEQAPDLLIDGELWFDDMQIRPIEALSPLARARVEATKAAHAKDDAGAGPSAPAKDGEEPAANTRRPAPAAKPERTVPAGT